MISASATQRLELITMSRVDKNRVIYEQLQISGPGSLQTFCDVLKKKRQTFIAERLEKGTRHCRKCEEEFYVQGIYSYMNTTH